MSDALRYPCQELVERLTDYLEDALPAEQARLVREHLALCHDCSAHLEQLRQAVAAIEQAPPETPSAEHAARVEALFQEWAAGR